MSPAAGRRRRAVSRPASSQVQARSSAIVAQTVGDRPSTFCGVLIPFSRGEGEAGRVAREWGRRGAARVTDRRSAVLLGLTTFFFWAALYLYVPILPVYAAQIGASLSAIGLLVGAYGVGQLVLRIPIGVASDRLGRRRPFVAAGLVAAILGAIALALAGDAVGLILARGITGVAAAAWVAFTVLFAGYFAPQRAPQAISLINFVNTVAQAFATYGGSLLAQQYGWQASFWGAALLGGCGLLTLWPVAEPPLGTRGPAAQLGLSQVAGQSLLLVVASAAALNTAVNFATSFGFVPIYAASLGASRLDLGTLSAVRLVPFAMATLATGLLVDRLGGRRTAVLGQLALALSCGLVPWTTDLTSLGWTQALGGIGFGLSSPVLMGLSIRAVPSQARATAMGIFQAIYSIGMIAGPWLAGWLAEQLGLNSVFLVSAGLALAALLLVLGRVPQQ